MCIRDSCPSSAAAASGRSPTTAASGCWSTSGPPGAPPAGPRRPSWSASRGASPTAACASSGSTSRTTARTRSKLERVLAVVLDVDPDDAHAAVGEAPREALQLGRLGPAGGAPGGPEVDQHPLAAVVGEWVLVNLWASWC